MSSRRPDPDFCRAGLHPWVPDNHYITAAGLRCRPCRRAAQQAMRDRKRGVTRLPVLEVAGSVVDPADFAHPLSDVRTGP